MVRKPDKSFPLVVSIIILAWGAGCGNSDSASVSVGKAPFRVGPLRIKPKSAAHFGGVGAENLEKYGHQASQDKLRQAATNVHAYLAAWVGKRWTRACSLASRKLRVTLKDVFRLESPRLGCPKMIARVANGEPALADTAYKATEVDAGSLRLNGKYGYIFFYLGGRPYELELFREGEFWKVTAPLPSPLQ
jgi:hypothetical protein